jgi:hypothetical protein
MLEALIIAATGAGLWASYVKTRDFVRQRLRFVDSAHRPSTPWIAGIGAALLVAPVTALLGFLPAVGGGTALLFGLSVGAGVKKGQKEVKQITGG